MKEVYRFYRSLYDKNRRFTESLEEAIKNKEKYIPEIQHIIEFYMNSKRGVTFWGRA